MRRLYALIVALLLVFCSVAPVAASETPLTVTSPEPDEVIVGSEVTVVFTIDGVQLVESPVPVTAFGSQPDVNRPDEGHLLLSLDLQPLQVWDRNEPFTFMSVPPGEHQLTIELVNNDHSSFDPPIVQVIRFRTTSAAMLPTTGAAGLEYVPVIIGALLLLSGGFVLRRRSIG